MIFLITIYRFFRSLLIAFTKPDFQALLFFVLLILVSGTIFYHQTEHWRYLDSFYFSVTTLTTVGYGDFHPTTDISKIFTVMYIFSGIGIILGFINVIATHARQQNPMKKFLDNKESRGNKKY